MGRAAWCHAWLALLALSVPYCPISSCVSNVHQVCPGCSGQCLLEWRETPSPQLHAGNDLWDLPCTPSTIHTPHWGLSIHRQLDSIQPKVWLASEVISFLETELVGVVALCTQRAASLTVPHPLWPFMPEELRIKLKAPVTLMLWPHLSSPKAEPKDLGAGGLFGRWCQEAEWGDGGETRNEGGPVWRTLSRPAISNGPTLQELLRRGGMPLTPSEEEGQLWLVCSSSRTRGGRLGS